MELTTFDLVLLNLACFASIMHFITERNHRREHAELTMHDALPIFTQTLYRAAQEENENNVAGMLEDNTGNRVEVTLRILPPETQNTQSTEEL